MAGMIMKANLFVSLQKVFDWIRHVHSSWNAETTAGSCCFYWKWAASVARGNKRILSLCVSLCGESYEDSL